MGQQGKRQNNYQPDWKEAFEYNSYEAWDQIRDFCGNPANWFISVIVILLLVGAFFVIRFLTTVRAPELSPAPAAAVETVEHPGDPEYAADEIIDDSNTVQPLLSGDRKENFYTFLLFGTDKEGTNTDTIMVVSYDVANQKLNLMSMPRDTMVNVGWDIKKINSVYGMRGLSGFQKQISKLIGFTPDYYVKIDLQAFVDVVDLIGGVEFDVPIAMHYHDPYQDLSIDLEPGLQTLNGEQAMGLVRFRKSDRGANGKIVGYDDTGRVQTQQAFLKAMFKKCVKLTNWTKISGYVEIFERNVESDLTLGNMLWFARQAMGLGEDGFYTVTAPGNYYASAYSRSTDSMQSYVTLYGREMVKLVNERFNPYLKQVSLANMDIMGINSDGSVYSSTGYVADGAAALPVQRDTEEEEGDEEPEEGDETPSGEDEPGKDGEVTEPADGEVLPAGNDGENAGQEPPAENEAPAEQPPEPQPEPEPVPQTETTEGPTTDTTPTESGAQ